MKKLYHGSSEIVTYPKIRTHKFYKDFYWGFYCTAFEPQAARLAVRHGNHGVVNVYHYAKSTHLKMLAFPEMTEARRIILREELQNKCVKKMIVRYFLPVA